MTPRNLFPTRLFKKENVRIPRKQQRSTKAYSAYARKSMQEYQDISSPRTILFMGEVPRMHVSKVLRSSSGPLHLRSKETGQLARSPVSLKYYIFYGVERIGILSPLPCRLPFPLKLGSTTHSLLACITFKHQKQQGSDVQMHESPQTQLRAWD